MERVEAPQDQLFRSIRSEDVDQLKRMLSDHPELVNVKRTGSGKEEVSTPLIEACRLGSHEVVKVLLDYGADFSATGNVHSYSFGTILINFPFFRGGFGSRDDVFPLFVAVSRKKSRVTDLLLSVGADVNQKTAIGQTALHVLCTTSDNNFTPCEFALDDDDATGFQTELMKTLIEHGADVNACDDHGKTALHYSAQNGLRHFVKILLREGANVYLKDKVGLTALDYAATKDYPLTMALVDKYNFPIQQIIEAYEIVALRARSALQLLRKATILRKEHGITKTVLPHLECYGYEKEWETVEEVEKYGENETLTLLHCLLAGERVSTEKNFDVAYDDSASLIWESIWKNGDQFRHKFPKHHFNSLLRHQLDRFSHFENYLYFGDLLMTSNFSLKSALNSRNRHCISTDVLVKFVQVAVDSCCMIQTKLSLEIKPVCVKELLGTITHTLLIIGGIILHLIKRSDRCCDPKCERVRDEEYKIKYRIAKIMLDDLLHRCPVVSAPLCGYASPVINFFFKKRYIRLLYGSLTLDCVRYNIHLMKMIIQSQLDINAKDCEGDTILHTVMSDFIPKIRFVEHAISQYNTLKQLIDIAVEMVQILLDSGSYPHARNKEGKCPADELPDAELR